MRGLYDRHVEFNIDPSLLFWIVPFMGRYHLLENNLNNFPIGVSSTQGGIICSRALDLSPELDVIFGGLPVRPKQLDQRLAEARIQKPGDESAAPSLREQEALFF